MEQLRMARRPVRGCLTRTINEVKAMIAVAEPDISLLEGKLIKIQEVSQELEGLDQKIQDKMLNEACTEVEYELECQSVEEYRDNSRDIRLKLAKIMQPRPPCPTHSSASWYDSVASDRKKRSFKLPKIELKKFSGELSEWMGWWAQFKKIDEDEELHMTDKFQYLIQATIEGSRARRLVDGYPQSEENYPKVIEALKDRFGDKVLLAEMYVRHLIKHVNKSQDQTQLAAVYDELESHLRALSSLGVEAKHAAIFLYPMVESCLPLATVKVWQRSPFSGYGDESDKSPEERLQALMKFLRSEVKGAERLLLVKEGLQDKKSGKAKNEKNGNKDVADISTAASLHSTSKNTECLYCGRTNHNTEECYGAKRMTAEEKQDKLSRARACYNSLKIGHSANKCRFEAKCSTCSKKHHPSICFQSQNESKRNPSQKEKVSEEMKTMQISENPVRSLNNSNLTGHGVVLLKTLHVCVKMANGELRRVRLLFDEGSQRSFIKTKVATESQCPMVGEMMMQNCLFGGSVSEVKKRTKFRVNIRGADVNYSQNRREVVLINEKGISGTCPIIPHGPWVEELAKQKIYLSDVYSDSPEIEILIGSDLWGSMMTGKMVKLHNGLAAVESIFGWTLSGEIPQQNLGCTVITLLTQEERSITDMWSLETVGIREPAEKITQEEHEVNVKRAFQQQLTRDESGRYMVKLPWISRDISIPNTFSLAQKRLENATKKLLIQHEFDRYQKMFTDWEEEGIIEVDPGRCEKEYFLPHRPVFKPESITTPVRPVFDASCRTGKGPSLNDCLEKGPNLLELIPSILLRFREKKIGVLSDVRKAFQMIDVHEEDRNFQKFLWWEDYEKRILKYYRHCRVVFGINCSPFILAAVLELHLKKVDSNDRQLADDLRKSLYVENSVISFDTVAEYRIFREKATEIMSSARMELRQWETNLPERVPEWKQVVTVLGMKWDKGVDVMFCNLPKSILQCEDMIVTKRSVLSVVSQIFDVIGVTCPALLVPKIMLQESWVESSDWDEEWSKEASEKFKTWCREASCLEKIRFPRNAFGEYGERTLQLHCFVDASKKAYAACVFIRVETEEEVTVQLLIAKSRLSPLIKRKVKKSSLYKEEKKIQSLTIQRLELMGCVIGSRLATSAIQATSYENLPIIYWSDSTAALGWIARDEDWRTFVGNRVREIRKLTEANQWRHVPGRLNPAGLPSRGCNPAKLLESNWWSGPEWLKRPADEWPTLVVLPDEEELAKEKRKTVIIATVQIYEPTFSSFGKNVRVKAWMRRFLGNCERKLNGKQLILTPFLTFDELRSGELDLVLEIQSRNYPEEPRLSCLSVKRKGKFWCVKSRLENKGDWESFKSPTLLPNKDPLVHQLIQEVHKSHCHGGTQFVLNKLRERYWIIHGRKTVAKVIQKCVICRRYAGKSLSCDPAPLPRDRVETQAAFQTTGVDLAGPVYLKGVKKAWIVIFTCAVYRGVHLDWMDSLSSEEFLDCLQKFTFQVGRPSTMYSDNGTNFVGAERLMKCLNWKELQRRLEIKKIKWVFNPPSSPWWGGWWERLVRTIKDLMRKMLSTAKLEPKGLTSCLAGVSYVINSRPLTTLTEDPDDLTPLTPFMFSRDLPIGGLPEREEINQRDLQKSYQKICDLKNALKSRFRKEYLGQLVERRNEKNFPVPEVGDVVLVGSEDKKRCNWPLAKIIEVIPGKDGKIRVAKVKTAKGVLTRPLQRLYPLEVSSPKVLPQLNTIGSEVMRSMKAEDAERVEKTRSGRVTKKPIRYRDWNF